MNEKNKRKRVDLVAMRFPFDCCVTVSSEQSSENDKKGESKWNMNRRNFCHVSFGSLNQWWSDADNNLSRK